MIKTNKIIDIKNQKDSYSLQLTIFFFRKFVRYIKYSFLLKQIVYYKKIKKSTKKMQKILKI